MSTVNTPHSARSGLLERVGAISPSVHRLLLIAGCALLFCLWPGRVPLVEVDETRYAAASRRMIETGDYIIPRYNGDVRYEKPILIYWIQGASMKLLGPSEFAARLPSGIGGVLLVLIVYGFLLRWLSADLPEARRAEARGAALLGAAALATLPLLAVWTRAATTDVTLTLFVTLTMLGLLQADLARRAAPDGAGRAGRWYLPAAFCCGLAFLTKGPIAVLVPLLTWLIYHLRQGTLRAEVRRTPWAPVILLFLVAAAPWYIATYFYDGGAFLRQFFFTENVARYAGDRTATVHPSLVQALTGRAAGIAGYLATLMLFLYPYGGFLLAELRGKGSTVAGDDLLQSIRRFAWTWIAVSVGFIALSKTQYPNYVQHIAAAVAIVFALYLLGLPRLPLTPPPPLPDERGSNRWGFLAAGNFLSQAIFRFLLRRKEQDKRLSITQTDQATPPLIGERGWGGEGQAPVNGYGGWTTALLLILGGVWLAFIELMLLPEKSKFVTGLLGKFRPRPWSPPLPAHAAEALMVAAGVIGILLLAAIIIGAVRRGPLPFVGPVMAAWTAFLALVLIGIAPLNCVNIHGPSADAGTALRWYAAPHTVAYCPGKDLPENLVFYGRREIEFVKRRNAESIGRLADVLKANGQLLLVTDAPGLQQVETLGQVTVHTRLEYFIIVRVQSRN